MTALSDLTRIGDLVPDGFLLVGADGEIVHANARAASLLATTVDALVGNSVEDFVPTELRGAHRAHRDQFAGEDEARPMGFGRTLSAVRADGEIIDVDIALNPIDHDGVRYVAATLRDISDRTAAEVNAGLLSFLVEAASDAVLVVDDRRHVVGCNEQCNRLLGWGGRDVVDRAVADLFPSDVGPAMDRMCADVLSGRAVDRRQLDITNDYGHRIPVRLQAAPIRHPGGRVVGAAVTLTDLSEIVDAQQTLALVQQQAERTEALADLGSWSWDRATDEMQLSIGGFEILELGHEDFAATMEGFLAHVAETDVDEVRSGLDRTASLGQPYRHELEITTGSGAKRWITIDAVAAPGGGGARGIIQDLTERHAAIGALLEADRMKDEFLSTVSHELRTPLTVICGFAALLAESSDDDVHLDAISRNAQEMSEMVDQLLDFSRLQSGRARMRWVRRPVRDLLSEAMAIYEGAVAGHDLLLDLEDVEVATDEHAFRRVFANLLTNAVKYSEPGTKITVSAHAVDPSLVRMEITDEGCGIAPEELGRVFERFHRSPDHQSSEIRGTGVGLSIVASYVALWGGDIAVTSRVGAGSTFSFTMPRTVPEEGAA